MFGVSALRGCCPRRCSRCRRAADPKGRRGRWARRPASGTRLPPTAPRLARAQNHALLYGPFPRGGLARGVSDPTLIMSPDATIREQALSRIRATGASVVRIPVEWRYVVALRPAVGVRRERPRQPGLRLHRRRRGGAQRRRRGPHPAARRLPRAGLRRSAESLAVRLPRELGAEPGRVRRIRDGRRAPLRRLLPRSAEARRRRCRVCGSSKPGTSPTSPATSSPNGSPQEGAGAPSRRCSTASC